MRGDCRTKSSGGQSDAGVSGHLGAGIGASDRRSRARSPSRELSLAQAIVDIATRHARGLTVAAIELRVGREREVAHEGLDFAFSLLTEGTALDGAELEIEHVAGSDLAVHALRLHAAR